MRLVLLGAVFLICTASCIFAAEEKAQMSFAPPPQILQLIGETDADLSPARYPNFSSYQSDNPTCGEYLKTHLSLSCLNGNTAGECVDFAAVPGLTQANFPIPAAYRKTSNLLVTWTVRVEGYKLAPYTIWPTLCSPWHGTSYQEFPGGNVKTRLYMNGRQVGQDAVMTLPGAGASSNYQPSDPTHTGSYLVTPQDFGGELPASIDIEIRWQNDTCMQIKSPARMRNLIITVMPIGKVKQ